MQYGVRWEVLAAINEIETDYGRNLNVSYAGALGWMQFMPSTWKMYGVDANQDGEKDPYNPVDAIFAAARYLRAAGADKDLRRAIFAYNHADWYVDSVLLRARVIGGLPSDLVGSLTGLTQGRFPVHAKATYAGKLEKADRQRKIRQGANAAVVVEGDGRAPRASTSSPARAPRSIAVNDGKILRIGRTKRLGRFVRLLDVYGNTYTYGAPRHDRQDLPGAEEAQGQALGDPPRAAGSTRRRRAPPRRRRRPPASARRAAAEARAGQAAPVRERQDRRAGARQGAPVRPPGAAQRPGRRRRRPARPVARAAAGRLRAARLRQEGLRLQAVPPGRPRDRRHRPRPHRQGQGRQGLPPAVRDPPGRPRRPARRPEADPRRLEAARVDRDLPRREEEPVRRRGRQDPHDRPDPADEQGDADPARRQQPADRASTAAARPTSAAARSTAGCSRRSSTSPPPA